MSAFRAKRPTPSRGSASPRHAAKRRACGADHDAVGAVLQPGVHRAHIVASRIIKADEESAAAITLRIDGSDEVIETVIRYKSIHWEAQRVGQLALSELCAACGHRGPLDDIAELHGIPLEIRLTRAAGGGLQIASVKSAPPLLPWSRAAEWPAAVVVGRIVR
jgi:hypothetical protein